MAFELSRVDRLIKTYDLAARFPDLDGPFTAATVALLPPRSGPNAATVWYTASVTTGIATVLFAGPDADPTGAVVVSGSADLWLKVGDGSEVDAVKVERIILLGGGMVTAPPVDRGLPTGGTTGQVLTKASGTAYDAEWDNPSGGVDSVNGQTGGVVLTAANVGAATAADITAASTNDRARANHTGTQAAGTITGLATVATTGAYADLSGAPPIPAAYTDEQARDAIGTALVAGAGLGVAVNDAGDTITVSSTGASQSRFAQLMVDETAFTPTITEAAASNVTSTLTNPRTYASVVTAAVNPLFRYNIADVAVNSGAILPLGAKFSAAARTVDGTQPVTIEFDFDGQAFEIDINYQGAAPLRVWANEQMSSTFNIANGSNRHYVKVDFGSRAQRRVVLEYDSIGYFFGIITAGTDTITRSSIRAPRLFAAVTDSYGAGWGAAANNIKVARSYSTYMARGLGYADYRRYALPSTGFVTTAGQVTYLGRISDVLSSAPDDVLVQGSYNDNGVASATITQAVIDYLTALVTGLPSARIIVTSILDTTTTNVAADTTTTTAIKAGVDSFNATFGSTRIGWIDANGSAWVTGTGTTAAPTGLGNADFYNSSTMGRHPSLEGAKFLGRNLAREAATPWRRAW